MQGVTDADRQAAEELRALLADLSGFWFLPGDTGPICAALTRHREQAEVRLLEKIRQSSVRAMPARAVPLGAEPSNVANSDKRLQRAQPVAVRG